MDTPRETFADLMGFEARFLSEEGFIVSLVSVCNGICLVVDPKVLVGK